MFHKEKDQEQESFSTSSNLMSTKGHEKKEGVITLYLRIVLQPADYSGLKSSGLGVQWPYGQL